MKFLSERNLIPLKKIDLIISTNSISLKTNNWDVYKDGSMC